MKRRRGKGPGFGASGQRCEADMTAEAPTEVLLAYCLMPLRPALLLLRWLAVGREDEVSGEVEIRVAVGGCRSRLHVVKEGLRSLPNTVQSQL